MAVLGTLSLSGDTTSRLCWFHLAFLPIFAGVAGREPVIVSTSATRSL